MKFKGDIVIPVDGPFAGTKCKVTDVFYSGSQSYIVPQTVVKGAKIKGQWRSWIKLTDVEEVTT